MARFYQTAQRNFQDDFIYQPNWELAAGALMKKDGDVADQLDTLDLFRNLPIDFWKDADQENVNEIKSQYENQVNDIVNQMKGDLTNTTNNRFAINNLRRSIEKDYESGRIRQIQDNAIAYKQYNAALSALKNPADREAYRAMEKSYLAGNENGAFSSIFKPDEMYSSRDIWGEFTGSDAFKNLKPDEKASSIENTNGRYIVTQGGKKVELSQSKIGQAFDAFIKSSNLQGYGADRQKYFGQQWLNDQGNIRMDAGSYLGGIMEKGIPSLAYTQTAQTKALQVDQYGAMAQQNAYKIQEEQRAEARAKAQAQQALASFGVDPEIQVAAANTLGVSKLRQEQLQNFIGKITSAMGLKGDIHGNQKAYNAIFKDKTLQNRFPDVYAQALALRDNMNQDRIASKAAITSVFGGDTAKADRFFKSIQNTAKLSSTQLHVADHQGNTVSNRYNFTQLNTGNVPINGNRVIKNSVEIQDFSQFIPVAGNTDIKTGIVAIPVTYKIPGKNYYNAKGEVDDDTDYKEQTDFIYSKATNFMNY